MDDPADEQAEPAATGPATDGPDPDEGEDQPGSDRANDDSHHHPDHDGQDGGDEDEVHGGGDNDGHDHDHLEVSDLCVAVLTVSSTRTIEEDAAGDAIVEEVEAAGHEVVVRELVNDSYDGIQQAVDRFVDREDTACVVTTGGTGVTPDDETIEAVEPLLDKQLPGFGELFRTLSYEEVGTRAVSTRATAGVADAVGVFCLPGSENAARLGTREIIVPESPHLVGLARQDGQHPG